MPNGLGGRELAVRTRQVRPMLKVLFISGFTESSVIASINKEFNGGVLSKPYRHLERAKRLLQMPKIDGVELLRRLATEQLSVPIVLMSGDDDALRSVGDLGTELGLDMRGGLKKPIRVGTFKLALEENGARA